MGNPKATTFLERLSVIAGGRKLTPWLTQVGWTSGDIDRVKTKGHVPGPDKLALLATLERVNLSWLLAEIGEPWIGDAPLGVRETAAVYEVLTPPKRKLIEEIKQIDDSAASLLADLLKALKRTG